jgi:hypothetical protein
MAKSNHSGRDWFSGKTPADLTYKQEMNQLGELRWSVQNLQIRGDLNRLMTLRIQAGTVPTKMDIEQQPFEYKMTSEIKSQDATSHRDYRNTNRLIAVS